MYIEYFYSDWIFVDYLCLRRHNNTTNILPRVPRDLTFSDLIIYLSIPKARDKSYYKIYL